MGINMLILILMLSITLLCFICSYQLKRGKWLMWIAGYNDLPKVKRDKIDGKALGKDVSKTMSVTGVIMIVETITILSLVNNRVENKFISASLVIVPLVFLIGYVVKKSIQGINYYKEL